MLVLPTALLYSVSRLAEQVVQGGALRRPGSRKAGAARPWRAEAACAARRVPSDARPTKEEHARFTRPGGAVIGGRRPGEPPTSSAARRAPPPRPSLAAHSAPRGPFPQVRRPHSLFRLLARSSPSPIPWFRGWFSPPELLPAPRPQTASLAGGARRGRGRQDGPVQRRRAILDTVSSTRELVFLSVRQLGWVLTRAGVLFPSVRG